MDVEGDGVMGVLVEIGYLNLGGAASHDVLHSKDEWVRSGDTVDQFVGGLWGGLVSCV